MINLTYKDVEFFAEKLGLSAHDDRWVSVEDKVPSYDDHNYDDHKVLCYSSGGQQYVCSYRRRTGNDKSPDNVDGFFVFDAVSRSTMINVSHWMPLPKKPKG